MEVDGRLVLPLGGAAGHRRLHALAEDLPRVATLRVVTTIDIEACNVADHLCAARCTAWVALHLDLDVGEAEGSDLTHVAVVFVPAATPTPPHARPVAGFVGRAALEQARLA